MKISVSHFMNTSAPNYVHENSIVFKYVIWPIDDNYIRVAVRDLNRWKVDWTEYNLFTCDVLLTIARRMQ